MLSEPEIAVIIPCLNEEATIAKVIRDFRQHLPHAKIYVCDNDSTDNTAAIASAEGAIVVREKRRGKGYVVQSMFRKVDADLYLLVDGDDTYPANKVRGLIQPIADDQADIVIGSRLMISSDSEMRLLNRFGNKMFLFVLNSVFGTQLTDVLSGYRVMTRDFVKNVPILSQGFEIEAELTVRALERGYRTIEMPISLKKRPEGSSSKIRIFQDGLRILMTIFSLFQDYRPLTFFGLIGGTLIVAGLIPGLIVIDEFLRTGLILKMPSAVLAVGLVLSGLLSIVLGLILTTISRRFQEIEYQFRMLNDRLTRLQ